MKNKSRGSKSIMEKIRAIFSSLKAAKYIPNRSDEINASSDGDFEIQKENEKNSSLDYNNSISQKPVIICPDHSIEIKSRFGKYKGGKYISYRFSTKILSWICLLLITSLLLLLIFGYYSPSADECVTAECVRSAAIIRLALNLSVNPCENFFQYTCGSWKKEYPLYPGYQSNSKFSKISERVSTSVLKFLSTQENLNDIDPVKQSRLFYKSCLDRENKEKMGFLAIYEYLEIVGLPTIPSILLPNPEPELLDWMKLETKIKKIFDMDVFIGFGIYPNRFNTLENLIYFGRPNKRCPMLRPYKRKREDKEWKIIIKHIIHQLVVNKTADAPAENLLEQAASIIDDMTSNVERFIPKNYSEDDNTYHVKYSFKKLQEQIDLYTREKCNRTTPQFLKKYMNYIFQGTRNNTSDLFANSLYIRRRQKPYLFHILTYLLETPDVHIELYLWWSVVVCMVMNSSQVMKRFILEQYNVHERDPWRNGNRIAIAHRNNCANQVVQTMGLVVAYGIANRSFSSGSGLKIKMMVEELRDAFKESIDEITWMDKKAKTAILEKSKNMYTFIGFPEWLFEEGHLEKYYEGMKMNSTTYLLNVMEIIRRFSNEMLKQPLARNQSDMKREFPKNPIVINAFNMLWSNSIVVPLAIVTFPLYHLGLEVLNYGTMGAILGHELIHGFDNNGWQYDKYGSYRKWLSIDLIQIFKQKSVCFKEQYDNATIEGVKGHVSGELTLAENIADNGGLRHALTAYRNSRRRLGNEPILPGFENFTHEQMFFIAYGSTWCQNISPQQMERQLQFDPHSPNSVRANMAVSNSEDFAKAFSCPTGSKMNPIKKCKIW